MWRAIGILLGLAGPACSLFNREGIELTCEQLENGAKNACQEGIITSCVEGEVVYRVCELESACKQPWQVRDAFGCGESETVTLRDPQPPAFPGSEPAYFDACGWSFETKSCAECVESKCCAAASACSRDLDCSDCAGRKSSEAQCTVDPLGLLEPFRRCHELCDCR